MDSTELRDQFRADVVDQVEPFLWSDDEVFSYMDDAQKMFCRLTGGLGDATSALTTITYNTATDWVATSPLILKIRDAFRAVDGRPIAVINYEDLASSGLRFDGRIDVPRALIIGMEADKARLYPFPSVGDSIRLVVDRLPLKPITDADQKIEIAAQHKTGLSLWMKARAYDKQDAETFDRNKAEKFDQKFRDYCAAAKLEKDRAKHKTRIVGYGGIGGSGGASVLGGCRSDYNSRY